MPAVQPEFVGRRQRKIIVDGVKYKAKSQRGCTGCAFFAWTGCATTPSTASGAPLCAARLRDDANGIVWIKKG